jgi:hypothetical protein
VERVHKDVVLSLEHNHKVERPEMPRGIPSEKLP